MRLFFKSVTEELQFIFNRAGLVIVLFIGMPFLTFWFAGAYYNEYVEEIPIAVYDEDGSQLSHKIIDYFEKNQRFSIKEVVASKEALRGSLDAEKVYMGLYIPKDLEKRVKRGEETQVLVLTDGSNIIIGNNIYAGAAEIVQSVSAGTAIQLLEGKENLEEAKASAMVVPFQFTDRMLYDGKLTYMNYLIYGFVAVFFQQLMLSALSTLILRNAKEVAQNNTFIRLLAKILVAATLLMGMGGLTISVLQKYFGVVGNGSIVEASVLTLLFGIAISAPAILLCAYTKDKTKFSQISYMLSLPTFLTCGYVWPFGQMPKVLTILVKVVWPLTYFARPFDEIMVKGLTWSTVKVNALALVIYSMVGLPIAMKYFKQRFLWDGSPVRP